MEPFKIIYRILKILRDGMAVEAFECDWISAVVVALCQKRGWCFF